MAEVGRYRKVYPALWLHPGFPELRDGEKVVAFYLLTGPQTNRIGIYRLSPNAVAEDLGTSPESFRNRLTTVCTTFGWLFDAKARVLYIPSWWRWNPPANANVIRGSLKDLKELPPCGLMAAFARNIETIPETLREAFLQGLNELFPSGFPNQDQDRDQNHQQEKEQQQGAARKKPAESETRSDREQLLDQIALVTHRFGNQDLDSQLDTFSDVLRHSKTNLGDVRRNEVVAALARTRPER
jgi:hypothetical protein